MSVRNQQELAGMVDVFYTLINEFIEANTSYKEARDIIDGMYEPEELTQLLEMEHDGFITFGPLAQHANLRNLLFYFCQLNHRIISKSLPLRVDGELIPLSLRHIFESDKRQYAEILDWITSRTQMTPPNDITPLQDQLASLANNKHLEPFVELLNHFSTDLINKIIHQEHSEFLDEVMSAPLEFLQALVEKDSSILQAIVYEERIIDILCESPEYNLSVLNLINAKYKERLSERDRSLLEKTLKRITTRVSYADADDDDEITLSISHSSPSMTTPATDVFGMSKPLLTFDHMRTLLAEKEFDQALMNYVNTELDIEHPVMDVLLFAKVWKKLAMKGIALMPTTSELEPINKQRFDDIKTPGKTFTYMTGLSVDNGELYPHLKKLALHNPFDMWPSQSMHIAIMVFLYLI